MFHAKQFHKTRNKKILKMRGLIITITSILALIANAQQYSKMSRYVRQMVMEHNITSAAEAKGSYSTLPRLQDATLVFIKTLDDDGDILTSIMFDMKNEADCSENKHKNTDYLKELESQGEIKKAEPKYESRRITGVSVTV